MGIDSLNIGEVGGYFDATIKISYLSDTTFIDFDFLILNPDFIAFGGTISMYPKYVERENTLAEFLQHKKMPIIVFPPSNMGTRLIVNNREQFLPFHELLPLGEFIFHKESGKKISVVPNTIFTDFLKKYEQFFFYTSYYTQFTGTVIAKTPHTNKVLAFYNSKGIFLPMIPGFSAQIQKEFLTELYEIAKSINNEHEKSLLPEWANKYLLPEEDKITNEIESINEQISALQTELVRKRSVIKFYDEKKRLFTGTGKELENEIKNIFIELGFQIIKSEENRDDLIVKYEDKIAVIEIKGVSGSSAEKHAAQLEKWVANYIEKTDIAPKGILVVNAYREIELENRNGDSFPNQMLKYSIQREHCLITTLQLLGIYYNIQKYPEIKDEIIKKIFETNGKLEEFQDWKVFITQKGA